jgi:hypothetical protein
MERQSDLYVSTLRRFIEAMGGELAILARFDDGPPVEVSFLVSEHVTPAQRRSAIKKQTKRKAPRPGTRR